MIKRHLRITNNAFSNHLSTGLNHVFCFLASLPDIWAGKAMLTSSNENVSAQITVMGNMYINFPVVPLTNRTVDMARTVVKIVVITGIMTLLRPSTIF